jgi:hypothetical protein
MDMVVKVMFPAEYFMARCFSRAGSLRQPAGFNGALGGTKIFLKTPGNKIKSLV